MPIVKALNDKIYPPPLSIPAWFLCECVRVCVGVRSHKTSQALFSLPFFMNTPWGYASPFFFLSHAGTHTCFFFSLFLKSLLFLLIGRTDATAGFWVTSRLCTKPRIYGLMEKALNLKPLVTGRRRSFSRSFDSKMTLFSRRGALGLGCYVQSYIH